jgi:7-cyano-7-deazaguanine synthase in queuosine biosynthesis
MIYQKIKELNLKNPILMFSGGVDSSLLAYLLLKNEIDFIALHSEIINKPPQLHHAKKVIKFLEKHFNKTIKFVVSEPIFAINHPEFTEMMSFDYMLENNCDAKFGGKTKNPPVDFYEDERSKSRPEGREGTDEIIEKKKIDNNHEYFRIRPFTNLDKRDLFEIYKEENLLNDLYPLTFSCSTINVKEHCNTCWFCQERLWGFGKMA